MRKIALNGRICATRLAIKANGPTSSSATLADARQCTSNQLRQREITTLAMPKPSIARLTTNEPKWAQLPTAKMRMMPICSAMMEPASMPTDKKNASLGWCSEALLEAKSVKVGGPALTSRQARSGAELATTCRLAVVAAHDLVSLEFGEGDKRHNLTVVDVRARDVERSIGQLLLDHFQHMLGAGRSDRDHHDAVRLQLLQQ